MRKFALSGLLVAAVYVASTVAGAETAAQQDPNRPARVAPDVIVVGDCRLGTIVKQDVPSNRNGQLNWLAVAELEKVSDKQFRYLDEAKRNEPVPATRETLTVQVDILPGHADPEKRKIYTEKNGGAGDRRYYERYYLQLMEGDVVKANQRIGQLDDRLARAEYISKVAKMDASQADVISSAKTRDEAQTRWESAKLLRARKAIADEEYRAAEVTFERYKSEYVSKGKMVDVAREELNQTKVVLELHEIRSKYNGQVKGIYKNPGEAVRELEPVVQIHSLERLRVEGLVDAQHAARIKKGMKAVIEAPRRFDPRTLRGHLQDVTCIAVSSHTDRPLVVSGSEDGTLRVWDVSAAKPEVNVYRHPTGEAFRSVACAAGPKANPNLCAAGSKDGQVFVYDLSKPSRDALIKMDGGHRGAVTTIAFSPDASLVITAGEDQSRGGLCVWDASTGKLRHQLPNVHGGRVTSVQFTSTNQVVSAARDNTLRLWTPASDGKYNMALNLTRRSGEVPTLGVSPDGKLVTFDQGKELRLLTLPDGHYAGSLSNATGTSPFTTLALFSPDGKLVLTASAAEGRMQLWTVPENAGRGREIVQLIPSDRSQPTCGAFAPNGGFIATGTKDRLVHIWRMPTSDEIKPDLIAEVMHVEPAVESGGRQVRIRADVTNSDGRLLLGDTVTMVIYPQ